MDGIIVYLWKNLKKVSLWALWIALTVIIGAYTLMPLVGESAVESLYAPQAVGDSHHQLAQDCEICHQPFQGIKTQTCTNCHEDMINNPQYSHTEEKMADKPHAELGDSCSNCHIMHSENDVDNMMLVVKQPFCQECHQDLVKQEEHHHHQLTFDSCQNCHVYHDNRAFNAKFVNQHRRVGNLRDEPVVAAKDQLKRYQEQSRYAVRTLTAADQDAPQQITVEEGIVAEWAASPHAKAGVNCSFCHDKAQSGDWNETPTYQTCQECHGPETEGYLASRHGTRDKHGLDPLPTGEAKLSMLEHASARDSDCFACHNDHSFDSKDAQVDGCLECHNDQHSLAYKNSLHYTAWKDEHANPGSEEYANKGVSCATCHFPREQLSIKEQNYTLVQHNVSRDLRPNHKMIQPVCNQCHGLKFTMRALNDDALIENNFSESPPSSQVPLLKFVKRKRLGRDK